MDDELLGKLLSARDDEDLRALIAAQAMDIKTVQALKARSSHLYFDQPAQAVRVAELARRLGDLLPDPASALGRWTLANALLFSDRYSDAVELFEEAGKLYRAADLPLEAARMGVGHVWALAYTGQFEEALARAAEIEPLLESSARQNRDDLRRLGGLFNNVGITNDLMGRYEEALEAYERQVAIARELGDELELAHVWHNRACALTYLNAFDEALAAFQDAEIGFQGADATADLARLAHNRGTLYARWGRYEEAEAEFAAADGWLSTLEGVAQARASLVVYRALARLESERAPDERLVSALIDAQARLATDGPLFEEGLAWLGVGRCWMEMGSASAAQDAFKRALEIGENGGGRPLAWEALRFLGNLAERRGNPDAASIFYQRAVAEIEAMRRDLYVGSFRAGFLADKLVVYRDLALLFARSGRLEEAFAAVEGAKSRLLAEQLAGRLSDELAVLTESDDPQTRALARRLRGLLVRLERFYRQARLDDAEGRGESGSDIPSPQTLAAVGELEDEVVKVARRMERDKPLFSPLTMGRASSLQAIQSQLQDGLLLQYYIARGSVWAFVVGETGIRDHRRLASLAQMEAARRRFSAAVERVLGLAARYGRELLKRYLPSLLADADDQLATLYDLLVRPLEVYLSSGRLLIISPDGPLHYVPFHALRGDAGYLIERHAVGYAPSATVLGLCARRTARNQGVLMVGYGGGGLAEVSAEVEALRSFFPGVRVLSGPQARADRLLADAPRHRILHLAAHARFRSDKAMLSSLSLADRRLTLGEIARLRLDADLVTLSGCETGRGRLRGADLVSLACAFLGAGARSLLVSLWRVDDASTARLMHSFYRALQGGVGRAAALRGAQLELLSLGRECPVEYGVYRHPAYWAPFMLVGAWGRLADLSDQLSAPVI